MFSNIGLPELLIVLVIALLLFGTRLPAVGRSLGEGIKNFKKGLNNPDEEESQADDKNGQPNSQRHVTAEESQSGILNGQPMNQNQNHDVVDVEHKDVHKS